MPGPIDLDARRADAPVSERKKLTLFRLNGNDYKVEARPPAHIALRFLDDLEKRGEDRAVARMMPALLGQDAWDALVADESLTMDEFRAVVDAASTLLLGQVQEVGKGNSGGE